MAFKPFKFDILEELDIKLPRSKQRQALEEAAAFLEAQMQNYISAQNSPVSGGRWIKGLTPEYKAKKVAEGGSPTADLIETGELLTSLSVKVKGKSLVIDVDKSDYGKAEGHLTGLYGNDSRIRPRQFMPQEGETFKRGIVNELKKILEEYGD